MGTTLLEPDIKKDVKTGNVLHLVCSCQFIWPTLKPAGPKVIALCGITHDGPIHRPDKDADCIVCLDLQYSPCNQCKCSMAHPI